MSDEMSVLEKILEEIKEKSKDMVTFDRPHKYYEAIETTIAEKIIRKHLETEKELENKVLETVRELIRSAEDIIELPVLGECDKNVRDIAQAKLLVYKECEHIINQYLGHGQPLTDPYRTEK